MLSSTKNILNSAKICFAELGFKPLTPDFTEKDVRNAAFKSILNAPTLAGALEIAKSYKYNSRQNP